MPAGLTVNGRFLSHSDLIDGNLLSSSPFEHELFAFYRQWLSGKHTFEVQTSGSTGIPQKMTFTRAQFVTSARQTIESFGLKAGQNVLLCLSPAFIAGKMMVVRALTGDLNLFAVEPSQNPLTGFAEKIHFAAVVPQQLLASQEDPDTRKKLAEIDPVIVGGGMVSDQVVNQLKTFQNNIWQTYGMTETLTHVAVRKISGSSPEKYYSTLKGVFINIDERNCLRVKSPVNEKWINTNDLVELIDPQHFRWLGRHDNVINSGGIKISPEEIEKEIADYLLSRNITNNSFVAGIPDKKLGEKLVLIIEGEPEIPDEKLLLSEIKKRLPDYKSPKNVILCPNFIYTLSGKIKRKDTLNKLLKL